jgi:hypothetical protein
VYDLSAAIGGPIARDRVWFFANARTQGSTRIIANLYYNNNAGDPARWTYLPDFAREVYSDRTWENISGRVTWQMTATNKTTGFWDEQVACRECSGTSFTGGGGAGLTSPESVGPNPTKPLRVQQVAWSSPVTNRLLLDAGFGTTYYGWGNFERPGNDTRDLVRVVEQCAGGCPANGNLPGLVYRSQDWNENYNDITPCPPVAEHIVGNSHALKVNLGKYLEGASTGNPLAFSCEVRESLLELSGGIGAGLTGSNVSPTSRYCHVAYGLLTQIRGLAAYVIPKVDLQISGVFQSKPGPLLLANYAVPAAVVAQSLGRPPAGNVPNVTVTLIEPGTLYGDRVNQFDLRLAKILMFGSRRATVGVDVYNVLNSGTVLTYNNTFVPGGTWLQPTTIMTPRLFRISGEFRF